MSLENKGRIRILRGNASNESVKTVSLYDGQPFYDTYSKHLYIGDGTHTIENTAPIIADANNIIFYCETPSNVSKKEINLPGYKLIEGQRTFIKFKENNLAQNPTTLSINKNESKNIYFNGKSLTKITDLTGYSIKFNNTNFTGSYKLNFYYKSSYYTELTPSVIDDLNKVVTIVGGEQVKNGNIINFINNSDNATFYLTNNIMANILYQLEYKDDVFYISEFKPNKNILWSSSYVDPRKGVAIPKAAETWLTLEFNGDLRGRDLYFKCGVVLHGTPVPGVITEAGIIFKTFGPYNCNGFPNSQITQVGFYENGFSVASMNSMVPANPYEIVFGFYFYSKGSIRNDKEVTYDHTVISIHTERLSAEDNLGLYLSEIYEIN